MWEREEDFDEVRDGELSADDKLSQIKKEMDDLDTLEDDIEAQDKIINSNIDEMAAMAAEEQDDEMSRMANDLQQRMSDLKMLTFKKLSEIRNDLEDEKKRITIQRAE